MKMASKLKLGWIFKLFLINISYGYMNQGSLAYAISALELNMSPAGA